MITVMIFVTARRPVLRFADATVVAEVIFTSIETWESTCKLVLAIARDVIHEITRQKRTAKFYSVIIIWFIVCPFFIYRIFSICSHKVWMIACEIANEFLCSSFAVKIDIRIEFMLVDEISEISSLTTTSFQRCCKIGFHETLIRVALPDEHRRNFTVDASIKIRTFFFRYILSQTNSAFLAEIIFA